MRVAGESPMENGRVSAGLVGAACRGVDAVTLTGRAISFNVPLKFRSGEQGLFVPSAFDAWIASPSASGCEVRINHRRTMPVAVVKPMRWTTDTNGLNVEFRLDTTGQLERDLIDAVRRGSAFLSLGVKIVRATKTASVKTIHCACVRELSVTNHPADTTTILSILET